MWKINKEAVLTGRFDSFCLPCESHLTQENVEGHISTTDHKDKLKVTSYVQKYQQDRIRKVKNGYYCEFCNVLLATTAKVGLHVSQGDHGKIKGFGHLKRVTEGVIAYDEVLIDDKSWHGLAEDTCCICDTEVTTGDDHKEQSSHILKLIQGDIEFKSSDTIYRIVDSTTLHCLICNFVFEMKYITSHFETADHKKKFQICCENKKSLIEKSLTPDIKESIKTEGDTSVKDNASDEKVTIKGKHPPKLNNQVNGETDGEKETIHPFEAIEEAKSLAKKNNIKYTLGKHSAYCKACDVTLSSTVKMIKEHIEEANHKEKLNKNVISNIKVVRKSTAVFIDTLDKFENCLIINDKFCIKYLSFHMMTTNNNVLRCQVCEVKIPHLIEFKIHVDTDKHINRIKTSPVITSLAGELIREVRPGLYHCAYCNQIAGNWNELENHLTSQSHKKEKYTSIRNLAVCLPQITRRREFDAFFESCLILSIQDFLRRF